MDTNEIKQEVQNVQQQAQTTVQQTLSFGSKLAGYVTNGWHIIGIVFCCCVLGATGFYIYHRFFHKSGIVEKPTVAVSQDFSKTDFSNEENLIEYVGSWLSLNAPYVLNNCVPNHVAPKDCKADISKTVQVMR